MVLFDKSFPSISIIDNCTEFHESYVACIIAIFLCAFLVDVFSVDALLWKV